MKLVQLLAKELKVWPEGAGDVVGQSRDGRLHLNGSYEENRGFTDEQYTLAQDWMSADVTKSQWQAELENMNKPKWIRHWGGKCPVKAGTKVVTRYRDGVVSYWCMTRDEDTNEEFLNILWSHNGGDQDIMDYYIEETKDQEIEEVKDTNLGTLTYKLEIDATEATKEIDSLVAKWGQIESPLKWRDEIIELEAYEEEFRREREKLIRKLESEGFKLIDHMAPVYGFSDIDMSDWRNWQAGDVFEVIRKTDYFTLGNRYKVSSISNTGAPINATDDDGDEFCLFMNEIKFIRRT